ncbi:MAG: polyhydroxyalkanoate synthesis regulator DNA-binding domain-containing protein [Polyangiaceae bacterium]
METAKETNGTGGTGDKPRRVIKRYSNRKLYDTKDSRYVTLQQIGTMVRAGEDVQIIDNATKEDKTEVTLALIISEDVKNQPRSVPLGTLRDVIQERGSRLLTQLREGPLGRILPGSEEEEGEGEGAVDGEAQAAAPPPAPPPPPPAPAPPVDPAAAAAAAAAGGDKPKGRFTEMLESSRQTFDQWQHQWQHALDERMRAITPGMSALQSELKTLTQRVEALEAKLATLEGAKSGQGSGETSQE